MKREIENKLKKWGDSIGRKVLLIRGARQVGKTYSVREFGKSFDNFVEVNFEEHKEVHKFFEKTLSPEKIIENLSLYFNTSIKLGTTLLFFDEIDVAPTALQSLRFFHEKMPGLHLIATGSLLEFAIEEIPSYGVGRIESIFMYPVNFFEFLEALDFGNLKSLIQSSDFDNPIEPVLHNKLLDTLKIYQLIGGLPEVVQNYILTRDLIGCQKIIDNLILTYIDDFAKYKKRVPSSKLSEVFRSIAYQAGNKFKYSNISDERSSTYKIALDLLIKASLAYKVHHTGARGLPLGAQINEDKFKVIPFDSGIYQRLLGLELKEYAISDYNQLVNKGNTAEVFVGNELIASQESHKRPEIYYWHREKRASNAELDYIISIGDKIIPIEVKSGTKGKMQSLYLFLDEFKVPFGVRVSGENFARYEKVIVIPAYACRNIYQYLG